MDAQEGGGGKMEYDLLERRLMDNHWTIESTIRRFESLAGALNETPELGWIHAGFSADELEYICKALELSVAAHAAIRNMRRENNELREKLGEVMHLRNCIAAKHLQLEGLVRGRRYRIVRDGVSMTVNGEDLKATDIVAGEPSCQMYEIFCGTASGIEWVCSECGSTCFVSEPMDTDEKPRYCPNCGRKVIE